MDCRWFPDPCPIASLSGCRKKIGIEFNYLVRSGRVKNTAATMAAALADPGHGT
jgi:hypothetical protein